MKYIQLDKDRYVVVDDADNAKVVVKSELEKKVIEAEARLKEIPQAPTDEELLAWAKDNYPMMNYEVEKQALEKVIADNTAILEEIK